jgi:hypothetical protein
MAQTVEDKNKAIVREAIEALFHRRDYARAEESGRQSTSSTARTSRRVATVSSGSSRACRTR